LTIGLPHHSNVSRACGRDRNQIGRFAAQSAQRDRQLLRSSTTGAHERQFSPDKAISRPRLPDSCESVTDMTILP